MEDDKVILIVDDEAEIIELVSDILINHGFVLLTASNGREAARILEDAQNCKLHGISHIDLIISDIRMPEMNGIELMQLATSLYPDVKRGFMTAYAPSSDVRRVTPTLDKPFTVKALIKFAEDLLFGEMADA